MRSRSRHLVISAAVGLALVVGACGAENGSPAPGSGGGDAQAPGGTGAPGQLENLPTGTEKLCGDKPIKLAHVDGFGANSWRKIVQEELKAELAACKNVTIDYSDAGGDVQKFNSIINSYVAKGYNGIVVFDDFGEQGLASMRNAKKAGLAVVPYVGEPGGTPGTDYTTFIAEDKAKVGQDWAKWLGETLGGKGNLIFMGGVAGNTSSPGFMNPFKEAAENAGFSFLDDKPVDTNWDPGQEQRVMAGLISKYGDKINGIASDYGVASVGGIRAFINANKPHPPLVTNASDNDLVCQFQKLKKKWPDFDIYSLDGSTRVVRWAGRRALAAINEIDIEDPTVYRLYPFIDTANGKVPKCNPNLPPDADLSSALKPEDLTALFSN
jgi:ribose transport system substrate-binding protein